MGDLVHLPIPNLAPEERDHFQMLAAYWAEAEDHAVTALEYAQRQREHCLRMLGMLAIERGLDG